MEILAFVLFMISIQLMPTVDTSRPLRPNKLISYSIPQERAFKKALKFHEDTYLNFTELTTKYGYPSETHKVVTEDGYILTVFRILSKCNGIRGYPVLMMHGLFDTSDAWIAAGVKIGLGFLLADNCYDIWAPNSRGSYYSRHHVSLDPDIDPRYWNFTFNELGYYDIPAVMDHVLQTTGQPKVFYMGHSQGTTQYFAMGALRPEYNNKIGLAILLAPVAWMKNVVNPAYVIAAMNYEFIKEFLESAGFSEILARDKLLHFITEILCEVTPDVCDLFLSLGTGYKPGTIDSDTISISFGHLFSGSSVKNLAHYAQLILSGRFQQYDEGKKGNMKRYGVTIPREYNMSLISSPVVLLSAVSDMLSTEKDVDILVSKLPNLVENYVVPEPYWSHLNTMWGSNAHIVTHPVILQYLNRFSDNSNNY